MQPALVLACSEPLDHLPRIPGVPVCSMLSKLGPTTEPSARDHSTSPLCIHQERWSCSSSHTSMERGAGFIPFFLPALGENDPVETPFSQPFPGRLESLWGWVHFFFLLGSTSATEKEAIWSYSELRLNTSAMAHILHTIVLNYSFVIHKMGTATAVLKVLFKH